MPAGFPAELGRIGMVDALGRETADPTAPLHRKKLLTWVSSLEDYEFFSIEGEEEWHPYTSGGTNDLGNLQAACRDCNRGKSATEIV